MTPTPLAVLGEALVDEFHDGPVVGGAPFNVARSLAALGLPVSFVSRIGADASGQRVLDSARAYGLSDAGLQRDDRHPTGRVIVHEGQGGHRFEILDDAAWDHLDAGQAARCLSASPPGIVYFGTLAQRHATSRAVVQGLVRAAVGLRFLDLNLRPGLEAPAIAAESLPLADWVKVNEEELHQLLAWFTPPGDASQRLTSLMQRFDVARLVVTYGAQGWALFDAQGGTVARGAAVAVPTVVDTVGAGDAFTALLLAGLSLDRDLPQVLALANRYAAAICAMRGPLPAHPEPLASWSDALRALPGSHS